MACRARRWAWMRSAGVMRRVASIRDMSQPCRRAASHADTRRAGAGFDECIAVAFMHGYHTTQTARFQSARRGLMSRRGEGRDRQDASLAAGGPLSAKRHAG